MRIGMLSCAGILLLAGCSDPKKASDANFKKAINAYLEKVPFCINAPNSSTKPTGQEKTADIYPAYLDLPPASADQERFKRSTQQFDALAKFGLLSSRTGTIDIKDFMSFSGQLKKLPVKIYDLTDTGRKALTKPRDGSFIGYKFCYGTGQVDEVTQFTEPSPALGMTVSEATYTYHVKDQADWATDQTVQEAFPELKQATGDKLQGKTDLVLTNNGWTDGRGSRL